MVPAYQPNQIVFINRLCYLFAKPKIGDVIVLQDPRNGQLLIKRIVRVIGNNYAVQGDNESASTDSRVFGAISKEHIVGKVIYRL